LKTFEQIHEEGSQKYGVIWLSCNQIATDVARYYGMDVTVEPTKTALSAVCLGFLNRVLGSVVMAEYAKVDEVLRRLPLGIFSLKSQGIDSISEYINQWRAHFVEQKNKWANSSGNERKPKQDGVK
jgi:hypothetical protein